MKECHDKRSFESREVLYHSAQYYRVESVIHAFVQTVTELILNEINTGSKYVGPNAMSW